MQSPIQKKNQSPTETKSPNFNLKRKNQLPFKKKKNQYPTEKKTQSFIATKKHQTL